MNDKQVRSIARIINVARHLAKLETSVDDLDGITINTGPPAVERGSKIPIIRVMAAREGCDLVADDDGDVVIYTKVKEIDRDIFASAEDI